jgi:hypothetical protein
LGFRQDTEIVESEDEEICPGTTLLQNDDGSFENGYAWRFSGVLPPEYGSWAECYDTDFVCGIQFLFTQDGYYIGQTMDVYVWESQAEGNPPPGPDPGNVICVLTDIEPGPIAFWPGISAHNVPVCCQTGGLHFVGFWPNWPMQSSGWYVAADENGPEIGCPRTKIAPGHLYPTGWNHANVVFPNSRNLGIREYSGPGNCPTSSAPDPDMNDPDTSKMTTWGQIKALY